MSKLFAYAVAACLATGLVLNILVATSCDFVQLTSLSTTTSTDNMRTSTTTSLGVFKYSVAEEEVDIDENIVAPTTTLTPGTTAIPTTSPTIVTAAPTISSAPSEAPSMSPSFAPTVPGETLRPTGVPSTSPTSCPTSSPTSAPTVAPTLTPTVAPSLTPTSLAPTTEMPSTVPTQMPSTLEPPTSAVLSSLPSVAATATNTLPPTDSANLSTTAAPTTVGSSSNANNDTTITSSPSPTTIGNTNIVRRRRQLQTNSNSPATVPTTTTTSNTHLPADTDGQCTAFGGDDNDNNNNYWDTSNPVTMAAQVGVIMAPVAGGVVLLAVGAMQFMNGGAPLFIKWTMPLVWLGLLVAQIGMALIWFVLQSETVQVCPDKGGDDDECEWELSSSAYMNIGAHIAYAVAAFASCKLSDARTTKQESPNEEQANRQNNNQSTHSDDFTPTIVNTAMLDDPTVYDDYDNDGGKRVKSLQAELDAQKQAAAMEAGKAQAVSDQLEDQQSELMATKEQLWQAQQEAEDQQNKLAAAAAIVTATTTVEALRAKELEQELNQQADQLNKTMAAMNQLESQIEEKEALLVAATAKSAAAVAEASKIQALQAELEKLRETGLGYYPAVWEWLGFLEPREDAIAEAPVTKTEEPIAEVPLAKTEVPVPVENQLAYDPAVWKWLGFIEPRKYPEYVARGPDPEGRTAKDLLLGQERKAKEDEMVAIAAAAVAAMETEKLKDELDQHRKDIDQIKAFTMSIRSEKEDPPMEDHNPNAVQPEGRRNSQLATPVKKAPGDDPPEETYTDPANDPDGVRNSAVKNVKANEKVNNMNDPPENTYTDPANDPGGRRSSQTPQKKEVVPPAHDPPTERPSDPANDPEEVRRSLAREVSRRATADPLDHEQQDATPGSTEDARTFAAETEEGADEVEETTATTPEMPTPTRNQHNMRKSQ